MASDKDNNKSANNLVGEPFDKVRVLSDLNNKIPDGSSNITIEKYYESTGRQLNILFIKKMNEIINKFNELSDKFYLKKSLNLWIAYHLNSPHSNFYWNPGMPIELECETKDHNSDYIFFKLKEVIQIIFYESTKTNQPNVDQKNNTIPSSTNLFNIEMYKGFVQKQYKNGYFNVITISYFCNTFHICNVYLKTIQTEFEKEMSMEEYLKKNTDKNPDESRLTYFNMIAALNLSPSDILNKNYLVHPYSFDGTLLLNFTKLYQAYSHTQSLYNALIASNQQTNNSDSKKITFLESKLKEYELKLEQFTLQHKQYWSDFSVLSKEKDTLETELKAIKSKLKQTTLEKNQFELELKKITEEKSKLQKEFNLTKSENDRLLKEKLTEKSKDIEKKFETKMGEFKSQIEKNEKKYEAEIEKFKIQLEKSEKKCEKIKREKNEKIQEIQIEKSKLEEEKTKLSEDKKAEIKKLEEQGKIQKKLKEDFKKVTDENSILKTQSISKITKINELKEQLSKLEKKFDEKVKDKTDNKKYLEIINENENKIKLLINQKNALMQRINSEKKEHHNRLITEIKIAENEISASFQEIIRGYMFLLGSQKKQLELITNETDKIIKKIDQNDKNNNEKTNKEEQIKELIQDFSKIILESMQATYNSFKRHYDKNIKKLNNNNTIYLPEKIMESNSKNKNPPDNEKNNKSEKNDDLKTNQLLEEN